MRISNFSTLLGVFFAALVSQGELDTLHANDIRIVYDGTQNVPGVPDGVRFINLSRPVINDQGEVAFASRALLPSGSEVVLWSEGGGTPGIVAQEGAQVPGAPDGVLFDGLGNILSIRNPYNLSANGEVTFMAGLDPDGVPYANGANLWAGTTNNVRSIVPLDNSAPGFPSGTTLETTTSNASINSSGQTAFRAGLVGPGIDDSNNSSLWTESSGLLRLVAQEGSQAPGTPAGTNFTNFELFYAGYLALNSHGQTAFQAELTGPGVDATNDFGIWSEGSGALELVIRKGDSVPQTPTGTIAENTLLQGFNAKGETLNRLSLSGPSIDDTNNGGYWVEKQGELKKLIQFGDQAPGKDPGVFFAEGDFSLSTSNFNNLGQSAFDVLLEGPGIDFNNDDSLWVGDVDELSLVAQAGDRAPGAGGAHFSSFWASKPVINGNGQVVFRGFLDNGRRGIWVQDRKGKLRAVAIQGQELEVAPGDFRHVNEVDFIGFNGGVDGRVHSFNDRGQLAFLAELDGAQGIFVSNVGMIPEPSSLLLFCSGFSALALRQKRSHQ